MAADELEILKINFIMEERMVEQKERREYADSKSVTIIGLSSGIV